MAWYKKLWNGVKKVGKYVAPVALGALIPGVGGAIGNAVGGLFSGKDGAQTFPVRNEGDPPSGSGGFLSQAGSFLRENAMPIVNGAMNYFGQQQTNAANAQMAQKQMDFQNQQTSSAYQRGTADMKAAGLNPMLAYSQGGAQSGGGASAVMGNELGAGANSALSAAMGIQQLKSMEYQNAIQAAEVGRIHADTDLTRARRADVLEGIGTHPVHRASVESGTARTKEETVGTQLRNNLLVESYKEQLAMYASARRAKDAEGELTAARIGEARGRSRAVGGFGDWLGEGQDAINSAKDYLGKHLGGWLPTPYDLRKYGKP